MQTQLSDISLADKPVCLLGMEVKDDLELSFCIVQNQGSYCIHFSYVEIELGIVKYQQEYIEEYVFFFLYQVPHPSEIQNMGQFRKHY